VRAFVQGNIEISEVTECQLKDLEDLTKTVVRRYS